MLRFAIKSGKFQTPLKSTFHAPKRSRPLFNNYQKRKICSSPIVRDTHYEVLGVESSANPAKISEAYRKKAMEWHPDRNKAANAKERFLLVQQAYSVLKDKKKRQEYDKMLEDVSNGVVYTNKPTGARVVRRRAPISFIFIGIIFLVSLWYKWNTFVPGTEDQSYLRNPREYYQSKQNKETED